MKSYCKFTVFLKFQLFNYSSFYYEKLKHAKVRDERVMKLSVQLPQLPTRGRRALTCAPTYWTRVKPSLHL